jgi:outer membrane protein
VAWTNSPRLEDLIHGGALELSLNDAVALAIENNLDIEFERFQKDAAGADLLRAQGGGTTRGLNYLVSEAPAGVGGPVSPLVTGSGALSYTGISVSTNPLETGALTQLQTNLLLAPGPSSSGPPVPEFDPALVGRFLWQHQSAPQVNPLFTGVDNLVSQSAAGSTGLQKAFGSGAQLNLSFDNSWQSVNSPRWSYSPYTTSGLQLNFVQPLLRGFGPSINRRYIRIAENQDRIGDLLFKQQLIETVYGVVRLYYDFVALYQDVNVKTDSLAFAERLDADTKAQVEQGTAAGVDATRAAAQVQAARLELERARGLLEEQQAILKNVLTRRGSGDPEVAAVSIVPTTSPNIADVPVRPVQDLFAEALRNRPDLEQARYQIENSTIVLRAARNNIKPKIDLVATVQNSGLAGTANALAPDIAPALIGGYGSALGQLFRRDFPSYSGGVQIELPLRNRIAEGDAARDEVQLDQTRIRLQQMRNQARLEIENSLIAIHRARTALDAAVEARKLQEQSVEIERAKFEAGASTTFFVMQYENALAQARSTEVVSRSALLKAQAALQRSRGSILEDFGISVGRALKNR